MDQIQRDAAAIYRNKPGVEDALYLARGEGPGVPIKIRIRRRLPELDDGVRDNGATIWILRTEDFDPAGTKIHRDDEFEVAVDWGAPRVRCRVHRWLETTLVATTVDISWG